MHQANVLVVPFVFGLRKKPEAIAHSIEQLSAPLHSLTVAASAIKPAAAASPHAAVEEIKA